MKKIIFIALIMVFVSGLQALTVRPVLDDVGFCWDKDHFNRLMDYFKSTDTEKEDASMPRFIAGISPHDDYLYAGPVYYKLFKRIKNVKEIVIFGVTHKAVRDKIGNPQDKMIFDNYGVWKGPYKPAEISDLRDRLTPNLESRLYTIDNEAHDLEHSIEAMIPFIQYFNPDVKITPIMITGMDFATMDDISGQLAIVLASYIEEFNLKLGEDIVFLISADANHYGPDFDNVVYGLDERAHDKAVEKDRKITDTFLSGIMTPEKIKGLTGELWGKTYKDYKDTYWCGKYSIPFGMLTVMHVLDRLGIKSKLTGKILQYSDTYSDGVVPIKKPGCGITAPFSLKHWVGFFSAGYYLE
jgi:MEMO1 family protein